MASTALNAGFPSSPFIDPDTGDIATPWRLFLITLYNRGGGAIGLSTAAAQASAATANTAAATAQAAANTAAGAVVGETAARIAGDAVNATAIAAEVTNRTASVAAEAATRTAHDLLLAPLAGAAFTGAISSTISVGVGGASGPSWTQGAAAPVAIAPVGSLYSRVGGSVGATLYVSRGAGTWAAVAGV